MTNAVAAALVLSGQADPAAEWPRAFRSWRRGEVRGVQRAALLNGSVALRMAEGWLRAALATDGDASPAEGQGTVVRRGTRPVAVCTVDGRTHEVSAICPHLKGVVRWNDAERSWDCPLHGSRFSASGELLEGPAVRNLGAAPSGS